MDSNCFPEIPPKIWHMEVISSLHILFANPCVTNCFLSTKKHFYKSGIWFTWCTVPHQNRIKWWHSITESTCLLGRRISKHKPPLGETAFWAAGHLQLPTHEQRPTQTHAHRRTQLKSFTSTQVLAVYVRASSAKLVPVNPAMAWGDVLQLDDGFTQQGVLPECTIAQYPQVNGSLLQITTWNLVIHQLPKEKTNWCQPRIINKINCNMPACFFPIGLFKVFVRVSFFIQKEIKVFEENIPGFFSIYWTSMVAKGLKVLIVVSMQLQRDDHDHFLKKFK